MADENTQKMKLQLELQAPLEDEKLSWRPGTVLAPKSGDESVATFFPYIDDAFLEQRLDDVLGITGWSTSYTEAENVTRCLLTLFILDDETCREGIGFHKATSDLDPSHSEHGARTKAFRDACRRFGICGRDIDGATTSWVKVRTYEKSGKYYVKEVLQPLTRALLKHSGAAPYGASTVSGSMSGGSLDSRPINREQQPRKGGTVGAVESAAASATVNGEASINRPGAQTHRDATATEQITWTFPGKFKGKPLTELDEGYLNWALGKMKELDPDDAKFSQWWYDAVLCALSRMKADIPAADMSEADLEAIFDGKTV